jgi:cytochrome c oxidase subunit 2
MLDPQGPGAERIARLWWLMLAISAVVFAVVVGFLVVALARRRGDPDRSAEQPRWGDRLVILGGVVIPSVILISVFAVSLRDLGALAGARDPEALRVEVEGNLWWWEVRYPDTGAITANEIHIPSGEPVILELTTRDVIHSVWAPELQAKLDMIPGRTNTLTIEADEPGVYRGQCAEYCGLQHARMAFYVVAHESTEFDAWLRSETDDRAEPATAAAREGERIFLTSSCAGCHAVRGTAADGDLGPDLTHVAARDRLAAGTIPNDRPSLERWISDPQSVKPGAEMPESELTPSELEAVLAYLEGLE